MRTCQLPYQKIWLLGGRTFSPWRYLYHLWEILLRPYSKLFTRC